MNDPSVRTDLPQRDTDITFRAMRDLQPGDWVGPGQLDDRAELAEVLAAVPYERNGAEYCCGLARRGDPVSRPFEFDLHADLEVRLASQAEMDAARDSRRRLHICAELAHLTDLIETRGFPLPEDFGVVRVSIRLAGVDDLNRVAEILGAKVATVGSTSTVTWPVDERGASFAPVEATWHAYSPDVAADPLGTTLDEAKFSGNPWTRAAAQAYEDDGFGYSREAETAVGTAPVPAYVQGEHMSGRDGATVRLPAPVAPVTRCFSFGSDHVDPDTGEDLYGRYVTVIGPSAEACREAMFASRYGNRWAFTYVPGDPRSDAELARLTEHGRIVVDSPAAA